MHADEPSELAGKIALMIEEVEQLEALNDRLPLITLMRETLEKALRHHGPSLLFALVLAAIAAIPFLLNLSLWIVIPATLILLAMLAIAASDSLSILGHAVGLYLTRFLVATQHDRAVAAFRLVLIEQRPLILYLRSFGSEERSAAFAALEYELIDVAHDALIVVSLVNPASDVSLRLSPIPKVLYPLQTWERLIELLCIRADRILLAADEVSEGVSVELQLLTRLNATSKTLFVNLGETRISSAALDAAASAQIELPTHSLLEAPEVWKWLGPLVAFTPARTRSNVTMRTVRRSRALRFAPASLYLLGLWSLLPSSDHGFYKRWLAIRGEPDPLQRMREELLSREEQAYADGSLVRPLDLVFDNPSDPFFKRWNSNKKLLRQLETSAMLLGQYSTWRRIRRYLRG